MMLATQEVVTITLNVISIIYKNDLSHWRSAHNDFKSDLSHYNSDLGH